MQIAKNAFGKMGNKERGYSSMLQLNYIFGNILKHTQTFWARFFHDDVAARSSTYISFIR
jgi:hypothetical protein